MAVQTPTLNLALPAAGAGIGRRRVLALILMTGIAAIFWVDSRYPALWKRYHAGTQIKATGALTFGGVYTVQPSSPYLTRVAETTVNWLDANRVGMTFSFLFGPAALVFLSTLQRRRTKSRSLNALLGGIAGVPLGVCSNCAAPIVRGLYASGVSAESVLATMFSSPALNVFVLAMTFALFPVQLAVLKLASVFFLIVVFAPAIARNQVESAPLLNCAIDVTVPESWGDALKETARAYAKSLWAVFRVAFPLMILAAVLGAFAVELIPERALATNVTLLGIVAVSIVSAFLPVPMAFDVAIAYILMTHGIPMPYVAAILCTLGIVSVYSLSVVGKTISWRIAAATYGVVVGIGILAGIGTRLLG